MPISMTQISQVTPEVLAAGSGGTTLAGVVLTENAYAPLGSLLTFTSADDVGDYFGLTSLIYSGALLYFAGVQGMPQTPGILYVLGYNAAAAAAWLRGAGISTLTLTQLQAISGTLIVTVDGVVNTSSSFNLSSATSFSQAATTIAAAFTTPNFAMAYDAQHGEFTITSNSTGASSAVSFATGTAATALGLSAAAGGQLSLGAIAQTPNGIMTQLLTLQKNWGVFTTDWEPVTADKLSFSSWTSATNGQYAYAGYDSDVNATTAGTTTTWIAQATAAGYGGSIPSWGGSVSSQNPAFLEAMLVLAWAASLNFNQANGRTELDFRSPSAGLVPSVTSDAVYTALVTNGYNAYGDFASNSETDEWYFTGVVTGAFKWASSYVNQIALNSAIQAALVALLRAVPSLPYIANGYAMVEETLAGGTGNTGGPIQRFINFGAIRQGVTLSTSQIASLISAIGSDVSNQLTAQGYYLQIQPASPSQRVARSSPPMTLWYTDGQSIQQLNIASINVQ